MLNLDSNIQFIKGVGEKRAKLFNSLGIFDVDSLIHFYPRKYEDWTVGKTLNDVNDGDTICIKATLITPVKEAVIRRGLTLYKCKFSDGENVIAVFFVKCFFNSFCVIFACAFTVNNCDE